MRHVTQSNRLRSLDFSLFPVPCSDPATGRWFYINATTSATTWVDPRTVVNHSMRNGKEEKRNTTAAAATTTPTSATTSATTSAAQPKNSTTCQNWLHVCRMTGKDTPAFNHPKWKRRWATLQKHSPTYQLTLFADVQSKYYYSHHVVLPIAQHCPIIAHTLRTHCIAHLLLAHC